MREPDREGTRLVRELDREEPDRKGTRLVWEPDHERTKSATSTSTLLVLFNFI